MTFLKVGHTICVYSARQRQKINWGKKKVNPIRFFKRKKYIYIYLHPSILNIRPLNKKKRKEKFKELSHYPQIEIEVQPLIPIYNLPTNITSWSNSQSFLDYCTSSNWSRFFHPNIYSHSTQWAWEILFNINLITSFLYLKPFNGFPFPLKQQCCNDSYGLLLSWPSLITSLTSLLISQRESQRSFYNQVGRIDDNPVRISKLNPMGVVWGNIGFLLLLRSNQDNTSG